MTMDQALRKRLIFTADDYGIRNTAEPILALARARKLDRVAVMTKYVTKEAALALIETGVKIDIHLELITLMGRGEELESGVFYRGGAFLKAWFLGNITRQSVEAEWRSQIERFKELFGKLPDGLNSHEHVHFFPFFFQTFQQLACEYQIHIVRYGTRGILWRESFSLIGWILSVLRFMNHRVTKKSTLVSSNWLIGLDWFSHHEKLFDHLPESGTVEIVVHPERPEERAFVEQYC